MKQNMITGSPAKSLFLFALPMVAGNLFQQLYNIIDSMVVGNYIGADALGAVGASTPIVMLFVAMATGMSIGCSVLISQFLGAGKKEEMSSGRLSADRRKGGLSAEKAEPVCNSGRIRDAGQRRTGTSRRNSVRCKTACLRLSSRGQAVLCHRLILRSGTFSEALPRPPGQCGRTDVRPVYEGWHPAWQSEVRRRLPAFGSAL